MQVQYGIIWRKLRQTKFLVLFNGPDPDSTGLGVPDPDSVWILQGKHNDPTKRINLEIS